MQFGQPIEKAILIKRYKRFLADMRLSSGEVVTAHCANPGAMTGLATPGAEAWLLKNTNDKAKLNWRWEIVIANDNGRKTPVGINTARANKVVEEALQNKCLAPFNGYNSIQREKKYGENSRIDFYLYDHESNQPPCFLEVKSATLSPPPNKENEKRAVEFPDTVSKRAIKHLYDLRKEQENGFRVALLFLAQRGDCDYFRPASAIDPDYANILKESYDNGLEIYCYDTIINENGIAISQELDIKFS
jgi:sugar fermentation stimulation protein A